MSRNVRSPPTEGLAANPGWIGSIARFWEVREGSLGRERCADRLIMLDWLY
jgi:hypothetical protein